MAVADKSSTGCNGDKFALAVVLGKRRIFHRLLLAELAAKETFAPNVTNRLNSKT
jgi:hypothetical protein